MSRVSVHSGGKRKNKAHKSSAARSQALRMSCKLPPRGAASASSWFMFNCPAARSRRMFRPRPRGRARAARFVHACQHGAQRSRYSCHCIASAGLCAGARPGQATAAPSITGATRRNHSPGPCCTRRATPLREILRHTVAPGRTQAAPALTIRIAEKSAARLHHGPRHQKPLSCNGGRGVVSRQFSP